MLHIPDHRDGKRGPFDRLLTVMKFSQTFSGLVFVLLAAALGMMLIWLPGWIMDKYQVIQGFGAVWGYLYLVAVFIGLVLLIGSASWTIWKLWGASISKKLRRERRNRNPSELSQSQKQFEIDENLSRVEELRKEADEDHQLQAELDPLIAEMEAKREAQTLEIVAFGTISSGKSSVLNLLAGRDVFVTDARGGTTVTRNEIPWPGMDQVFLVDTPGLGEVDGELHVEIAADSAEDADLVIVVVDGPLRESEHTLLEMLGQMEKRILIALNKSDWYSDEDRQKLIGQIERQTVAYVNAGDVVSIQAQESHRIRRRVTADGTEVEEQVPINPDIEPLADRMLETVKKDGKDLLMANLLLQSRGLVEKARGKVKQALNRKANGIVDKYMWGAAGVAAVNPFPFIDLAAGVGISTKMILDLADVYGQKVDLETARTWLGQMGKILVGVLGYQGASMAVASVVASLIKSVPIAGTLAGNAMQGSIQALLTRWVGHVFVEYFENEMQAPEGGLAGIAKRHWNELTTAAEIGKLVKVAREKLSS